MYVRRPSTARGIKPQVRSGPLAGAERWCEVVWIVSDESPPEGSQWGCRATLHPPSGEAIEGPSNHRLPQTAVDLDRWFVGAAGSLLRGFSGQHPRPMHALAACHQRRRRTHPSTETPQANQRAPTVPTRGHRLDHHQLLVQCGGGEPGPELCSFALLPEVPSRQLPLEYSTSIVGMAGLLHCYNHRTYRGISRSDSYVSWGQG